MPALYIRSYDVLLYKKTLIFNFFPTTESYEIGRSVDGKSLFF